jgi:DNA-directed RNA polymerase specialized sigma24 family protein
MNMKTRARQHLQDGDARRQAVEECPRDGRNPPAYGSREWFDAVYPPLRGYLTSFAAPWADDGATAALLRFQEKGQPSRPLGVQIAWLRQVGHNWIVSQLRSRWERDAVPLPPDRVGSDGSEDDLRDVVRDGLARFLRRLRRRLPEELDELIRLRFDAGMTLRQIADQLGGEGATDARRCRVRRRINKALALLRSGLRRAGLDALPGEWEGLRADLLGDPRRVGGPKGVRPRIGTRPGAQAGPLRRPVAVGRSVPPRGTTAAIPRCGTSGLGGAGGPSRSGRPGRTNSIRRPPRPARIKGKGHESYRDAALSRGGRGGATMDATRSRRTRDRARQAWYAGQRQRRFARFLAFLSVRGSDPERIPSTGSVIPTGRRED